MALGAVGTISVLSNLAPGPCVELVRAAAAGDFAAARELHFSLAPLVEAYASGANPVPLKTMMFLAGQLPAAVVRSPLVEVSEDDRKSLSHCVAAWHGSVPGGATKASSGATG